MEHTLNEVADSAAAMGRNVKDSVVEFGKSASRKIDTVREHSGDSLRDLASSLRQASARMHVLAGSAASSLDAAATAVKKADFQDIRSGMRRLAQNNLAATVLAAIALGYFIASALNRGKSAA